MHSARSPISQRSGLLLVIVWLLALWPRVSSPHAFISVDEAYHWFDRVKRFHEALQQGDFAATNLIGHPGVTTLWLGAAGRSIYQTLVSAGWFDPTDVGVQWVWLRLPIALITALCVVLAYPLLRRLAGGRAALLAVLLWATDPFLVAFSRIVHVDALLTSFMTLSLLSALLAFRTLDPPAAAPEALTRQTPPALDWPMLVVSAVAGGLALLTKSPAILLLPMIGVLALFAMIQLWPAISHFRQLALISSSVLIWLSIAAVLWLALWPAAWVDPAGALARVVMQAQYEGGSPHGWGNFFLGQPVNDPGPLFYPVALAFRLTPWASVGLLAALVATLWRRPKDRQRRLLFVLVGYVGCFLLVFTMAPKKFDRYLLPIVPSLQIIAAIGLVVAWRWAARRWSLRPAHQLMLTGVGTAVLLLNLACYHPYAMAYYNPLLGGGSAAANVIPVGWGEGLDQAGAFLQQQFNGCDYPVATWFVPVLQPYSCTPVVPLDWASEPGRVDYAVLYIDQLQRNNRAEITHQLSATQPPLHRVVIHGIPYALIYQLPPTANPPPPVDFGSLVRLYDYAVDDSMLRSDGVITVTTHWQARNQIERDYLMFVHVLDAQGERLGGVDVPPGGPRAPTRVWLPWQYSSWFHPVPLPNELPAGDYWLSLGLYDAESGQRLPPAAPAPAHAPDDGGNTLFLPLHVP